MTLMCTMYYNNYLQVEAALQNVCLVFCSVMLQHDKMVKSEYDIRRLLEQRHELFGRGKVWLPYTRV